MRHICHNHINEAVSSTNIIGGNPSHSPIGKHFPNSKYENVKNKQIQISIFAPAGTKILDLFDSEHIWSPGNPC